MEGVLELYRDLKEPLVKGTAKVQTFSIGRQEASLQNVLSMGRRYSTVTDGDFVKLHVNGTLMMSDTYMERHTNSEFVRRSHGDILIAGLGIGLVPFNMKGKDNVKSITIVEKYQDVIDLIAPRLESLGLPIEYVCSDIFDMPVPKGKKWDCIYFDIWPYIQGDNYEDMKRLNRKFKYNLNRDNPNAFMTSWLFDECKRLYKQ